LYQHFKAIATATDKSIILYNVPGRTVTNMQATTTLRLAHEFKNIVAIKEASGNFAQCMDIIKDKPAHFTVLSGDDDLVLPQISMGIQGVISVAANCFTKEFTSMVNHALQGDFATAQQLHYKLLDGIRLLFVEGNPAGVKTVLAAMNIGNDTLRLPLVNVSEATKNALQQYLKNLS
jgi:4-hydroxy-tetrahydrodipicolinate synthase